MTPQGNVFYIGDASGKKLLKYIIRSHRSVTIDSCEAAITCLRYEADTLWIGTAKGIERLVKGHRSVVLEQLCEPTYYGVIFMRRGPGGDLWYGTNNGLYHLNTRDGVCHSIGALAGRCVRSMEPLDDLWFIGTYGDGAYLLGDSVERLPLDAEHALIHTHAALLDERGQLWLSTNNGLLRTDRSALERWFHNAGPAPRYDFIGTGAAARHLEFNGGCDPPFARLANGLTYFPTLDGVLRIWLDSIALPLRSPAGLVFEDFIVDGRVWPVNEHLVLPPGTKEIRVNISMSYWGDPRALDLSFGLDGDSGQGFPMTPEQRQLVIMNPTPGEHELVIRNAGVPINGDVSALWFEVKPRFFRSSLGMLIILVGVAGVVILVSRWWSGRLERRNRQLEFAVNERTRELTMSNDRLQLTVAQKDRMFSILNHDIVSPLRFIERVARRAASDQSSEGTDRNASKETFEELSFAATRLHANAQNLLNWVKHQDSRIEPRPAHTVVSLLVDEVMAPLLPQAAAKGVKLINEVPLDDVMLIDRDILGIILSNLMINAVSNTNKGSVCVLLLRTDAGWSLRIQDTGPGFPQAVLDKLRVIQEGVHPKGDRIDDGLNGLGYIIIQELMTLIGARFEATNPATGGACVDLLFS